MQKGKGASMQVSVSYGPSCSEITELYRHFENIFKAISAANQGLESDKHNKAILNFADVIEFFEA